MRGLHELLFLLFSTSETMLTVLVKPFIVDVIRREVTGIEQQTIGIPSVNAESPAKIETLKSSTFSGYDSDSETPARNDTSDFKSIPANVSLLLSTKRPSPENTKLKAATYNRSQRIYASRNPASDSNNDNGDVSSKDGDVKTKTAVYLMIDLVGSYLPWTIIGPFCGTWSDRHGRKLPLLLPSVCHVLSVVTYIVAYHRPDKLLAAVIVGSLCRGLSGKHNMFSTVILSLASDTSQGSERSSRYASLTAARYLGMGFGSLGAGVFGEIFGVKYSMMTSSFIQAIIVLLVIAFVEETVSVTSSSAANMEAESVGNCAKSILRCCRKEEAAETDCLKTTGAKQAPVLDSGDEQEEYKAISAGERESLADRERFQMQVLMLLINVISFVSQALWSSHRDVIVQSVTAPPFDWPASWYGYLIAVYFSMTGVSLLLVVPLLERTLPPGVDPDAVVLLGSLVCGAVCGAWTGFAVDIVSSWQIFCAFILGGTGPAANSPLKSMMSQCVGESNQGRMLAVQSVLEGMATVVGPITHTAIYVASLPRHPSLVYYVMAGEATLLVPVAVWTCTMFQRMLRGQSIAV